MSRKQEQQQARRKAELILKVRAGELTAADAARRLGVSRKTYYKWEQRGLAAMLEGLHERSPGRPSQEPDPEAESLRQRVLELEKELDLHKQSKALRDRLRGETEKKRMRPDQ